MKTRRRTPYILGLMVLLVGIRTLFALGAQGPLFHGGEETDLDLAPWERVSDLDELNPKTREKAELFLKACQDQGLEVVIVETYRSQERQDYLYAQGRTREGPVVTWTKKSRHTQRCAFDICKAGPDPYGDDDFFRRCAEIGRDLGLNPGYYWEGTQDKPHFQYDKTWGL
ncbi:MAG: M15 family metallopeptidase [Tissierellia bacterium]|nr:M15 family metallopeptidase [Tissierellia bacterium]